MSHDISKTITTDINSFLRRVRDLGTRLGLQTSAVCRHPSLCEDVLRVCNNIDREPRTVIHVKRAIRFDMMG